MTCLPPGLHLTVSRFRWSSSYPLKTAWSGLQRKNIEYNPLATNIFYLPITAVTMIMLVAGSLKAVLCSDDCGKKDLLQRERGLEMATALCVQVLLKQWTRKIQTLGERSAMYSAKLRSDVLLWPSGRRAVWNPHAHSRNSSGASWTRHRQFPTDSHSS